jgi:hypothetical protein
MRTFPLKWNHAVEWESLKTDKESPVVSSLKKPTYVANLGEALSLPLGTCIITEEGYIGKTKMEAEQIYKGVQEMRIIR